MKTSFYFFLWIIIYPLLGLFHNPWMSQNSFIIALFLVWGLSWFLNKNMSETLRYERSAGLATIMEDIFNGNTRAFRKRLSTKVIIDFITSIYMGVAFIFILFSMVRGSNADDWVALLIFAFFSFGTISRAVKLNQVNNRIKNDPTPEECAKAIEAIYHADYSSYYNVRLNSSPQSMLPPRPKYFNAFQIFSMVIAVICALLGIAFMISAIITMAKNRGPQAISGGIMYFLYGSLAAYFGIKDLWDCISYFRNRNFLSK